MQILGHYPDLYYVTSLHDSEPIMTRPIDPTTNGDALGYILNQAADSHPNGRERALTEKCAEYLAQVVKEHAAYRTALLAVREHLTGGAEFETMADTVDAVLGGKTELP